MARPIRLARLIPLEDQERLGIEFVLRTGPAAEALVRDTTERQRDLALVQARGGDAEMSHAHALREHRRCAVLVLR